MRKILLSLAMWLTVGLQAQTSYYWYNNQQQPQNAGIVSVSNPYTNTATFRLQFDSYENSENETLGKFADLILTLDQNLLPEGEIYITNVGSLYYNDLTCNIDFAYAMEM